MGWERETLCQGCNRERVSNNGDLCPDCDIKDREAQSKGVFVPLTDKERSVLNELAQAKDLSPEQVMLQALRLYQMVSVGAATVVFPPKVLLADASPSLLPIEAEGV